MACACIWVSNCSSTRSAVRRSASSRKRRQVAGRKIMLERSLGLLRNIDLALPQALDQVVWREVDHFDLVGSVEDRIRHRLPHAHAGDLGDDIVEAFDMLDVERGIDVDAGGEQLLDIEIALGWRLPAHWYGRVRRPGRACGRRARRASRSISSSTRPLYSTCFLGTISNPQGAPRLDPAMGFDDAATTSAPASRRRARKAASRRSCRRQGLRRGKSSVAAPRLFAARQFKQASGDGRLVSWASDMCILGGRPAADGKALGDLKRS